MSSPTTRRRARALASITAAAGLGLAAVAVTTSPATSAAVAGDCAVPFPVAELVTGDPVTGLTVTQGTTPSGFTGEVLGVLQDGIGPDVDMIMMDLTSTEIDRVGIWQGMSGSPVYAEDGRLIGAVSYSLAQGASTVAGVTPYEVMDDHMADPAEKVSVDKATARTIARQADVSLKQAARGFAQLPMPVGVAGVGAQRLATAADRAGDRTWLPRSAYAVGRAAEDVATVDDIVAGGNLAASMAYGDVTIAGVGTVTSVCNDRVVGFGHPAAWAGETTLGLHPADAIHIQNDIIAGFKVANLGGLIGTITQDRLAGITGDLGELPETADIDVTVTQGDKSRTGVSHVPLRLPDPLASTTFYGLIANHQAVVDGPVTGTEDLAWTITGTEGDGTPFELSSGDLYASSSDLLYEVGFEVGDMVYYLAQIDGVTIDSVTTSSDLTEEVSAFRLESVEARKGGAWVTVNRRNPLVTKAGRELVARANLVATTTGETVTVPIRLNVPKSFAGRFTMLQVTGGASIWSGGMPNTVDKVQTWLDELVRNDELQVTLSSGGRVHSQGSAVQVSDGGMRGAGGPRSVETVVGPVDGVARGRMMAAVVVR